MSRAKKQWASPVASHNCTFGTVLNIENTRLNSQSQATLCLLAYCLVAFLDSVQGCDATGPS